MLSYAGVTLDTLDLPTQEVIESRLSANDIYPWDINQASIGFGGFGLSSKTWRDRPIRLGRLSWPIGASRWATAFYAVSQDQLESIRAAVYGPGYQKGNLIIGDGVRKITASMYMLQPRPLAGQLWLLPLVDVRFFWWNYNCNTFLIVNGDTWTTAITRIANLVTSSFSMDSVSSAYYTPPNIVQNQMPVPPMFDFLAQCVGQRVVVGLDGSVQSLSYASSASLQNANLNPQQTYGTGVPPLPAIIGGGKLDIADDLVTVLPEQIDVDFAPGSPNAAFAITTTSIPGFSQAKTNGTTKHLTHPYNSPDTPHGSTLALQFATDYCSYLSSALGVQYGGIASWTPEGLEDWIEWTYTANKVSTRVEKAVWVSGDVPFYSIPYLSDALNTFTPSTSWTNSGLYLDLPPNSVWRVDVQATAVINALAAGDDVSLRLYDGTNQWGVTATLCEAACANLSDTGTATLVAIVVAGTSTTRIQLQGIVNTTSSSSAVVGPMYICAERLN